MPARLVQITIRNNTSFPLRWITDSDDTTTWQDPWFPSKLNGLRPGQQAAFRSESPDFGVFVGTEGSAVFEVGRPVSEQFPGPPDRLEVRWELPYIGVPHCWPEIKRGGNDTVSALAKVVGILNMEGTSRQEFGWEALTVLGNLPLAWASEISPNAVEFIVEVRDAATVNLFPTGTPAPKANPADAFHFLAQHLDGAVGGFPNFIDPKVGPNFMRGGVLLTAAAAEWRDVPLSQLGRPEFERQDGPILVDRPNRIDRPPISGPVLVDRPAVVGRQRLVTRPSDVSGPAVTPRLDPGRVVVDEPVVVVPPAPSGGNRTVGFTRFTNQPSLDDFAARMRASNDHAARHGFLSGFPTFFHADHGQGIVCGTVLIRRDAGEWRDVPLSELGVALDDIPGRFRATQQWASSRGFIGGFPNFFHADHGAGIVCGTILLKAGPAKRVEIIAGRDPR
ncbi:hypothetical protein KXS11_08955 [Plantibacter flavus]|uniref:hypothetical protein n=1 Tax=Plantibacter flavus TaxID=150123 RepID=UPI003F178E85